MAIEIAKNKKVPASPSATYANTRLDASRARECEQQEISDKTRTALHGDTEIIDQEPCIERQAVPSNRGSLLGSLPNLTCRSVFFFVSIHGRPTQAWIFLRSHRARSLTAGLSESVPKGARAPNEVGRVQSLGAPAPGTGPASISPAGEPLQSFPPAGSLGPLGAFSGIPNSGFAIPDSRIIPLRESGISNRGIPIDSPSGIGNLDWVAAEGRVRVFLRQNPLAVPRSWGFRIPDSRFRILESSPFRESGISNRESQLIPLRESGISIGLRPKAALGGRQNGLVPGDFCRPPEPQERWERATIPSSWSTRPRLDSSDLPRLLG